MFLLILALLFQAPAQPQQTICSIYGIEGAPSGLFAIHLACQGVKDFTWTVSATFSSETRKWEFTPTPEQWPKEWPLPRHLKKYNAEIRDGKIYPLLTAPDLVETDPDRIREAKERARWRYPNYQ